MNERPCSDCGDLEGCHTRSRLARFREAVERFRQDCKPYGFVVPRVVCLCGSTRFWRQFQEVSLAETLAGRIVLSIGAARCADGDDKTFGGYVPADGWDQVKEQLDTLHFRKIDFADEILVLNVGGYVGDSTRREIEYARTTGKPVRFLEPVEKS